MASLPSTRSACATCKGGYNSEPAQGKRPISDPRASRRIKSLRGWTKSGTRMPLDGCGRWQLGRLSTRTVRRKSRSRPGGNTSCTSLPALEAPAEVQEKVRWLGSKRTRTLFMYPKDAAVLTNCSQPGSHRKQRSTTSAWGRARVTKRRPSSSMCSTSRPFSTRNTFSLPGFGGSRVRNCSELTSVSSKSQTTFSGYAKL
mmetsp:Transcript_108607/g.346733  ORF Transcript_108607/g.346733 Transcript_108607/m.346733 type:complete len:200 (-) Transcript_108607:162-761(-)